MTDQPKKNRYYVEYESFGRKYGEGRFATSKEEASKIVEDYYKKDYPDVKITKVILITD
jgi:hypothetical protein